MYMGQQKKVSLYKNSSPFHGSVIFMVLHLITQNTLKREHFFCSVFCSVMQQTAVFAQKCVKALQQGSKRVSIPFVKYHEK